MITRPRRGASVTLLLLLAFPLLGQQSPGDAPAFTADPKELIVAAGGVQAGDFSVVTK